MPTSRVRFLEFDLSSSPGDKLVCDVDVVCARWMMTTGGSAANVVSTAVSLKSRRRHRCHHGRFDPCLMFRRLSIQRLARLPKVLKVQQQVPRPGSSFF